MEKAGLQPLEPRQRWSHQPFRHLGGQGWCGQGSQTPCSSPRPLPGCERATSRHSPGAGILFSHKRKLHLQKEPHLAGEIYPTKSYAQVVINSNSDVNGNSYLTTILSPGKPTSVSILRQRYKEIQLEKCSEKPGDYNYSYTRERSAALIL